jgi:hypothetical protein
MKHRLDPLSLLLTGQPAFPEDDEAGMYFYVKQCEEVLRVGCDHNQVILVSIAPHYPITCAPSPTCGTATP